MNLGATNRQRHEPSPSADFQGDHNRSDESRNMCSCVAFPSCSLIVQRVDDTNHVFSRLFQFLYNKFVYKQCVFPVIPVIQSFRNYGKSVSGTFLNWENTVFVNNFIIKQLEWLGKHMLCKHFYVTRSENDWGNTWVALSNLCQGLPGCVPLAAYSAYPAYPAYAPYAKSSKDCMFS